MSAGLALASVVLVLIDLVVAGRRPIEPVEEPEATPAVHASQEDQDESEERSG